MSDQSPIEWTEATWNPIAGCSLVSPGCTNCYAMRRVAPRLAMNPATPHYAGTVQNSKAGPVWTGRIGVASDAVLMKPLRWRRPRTIFVNSTSDLFHLGVPDAVIDRIFAVMALCPQHTFQVLTKRPERMRAWFDVFSGAEMPRDRVIRQIYVLGGKFAAIPWPLPNVWLGTSVEDQQRADERIPHLLATPAAVRFISAEPLLGPIDVLPHLFIYTHDDEAVLAGTSEARLPFHDPATTPESDIATPRLDWVIVGGESGTGARPMHPDWVRSLRDQCADAQVPFFFKQWGEWLGGRFFLDLDDWVQFENLEEQVLQLKARDRQHWWDAAAMPEGPGSLWVGRAAAGRLLDGVEHNGMPGGR